MRKYIDENDKKNEIRLLFSHPLYKDKIIVIVEGRSDIRLFRNILNNDNLHLETMDGKDVLLSMMRDLINEFPNKLLAICDADFCHLSDDISVYEDLSIYVTDLHDAEMMILNSPSLVSFIDEFSSNECLAELKSELLSIVLDAAYSIGLLRWINVLEEANLRFEGLNFSKFIDIELMKITLDEGSLIEEVLLRSNNKKKHITYEYLVNTVAELREKNACKLQVCCGHDVTKIISMIYRKRWASIELNMDQKKVESALRIGYQKEYFFLTSLFQKLDTATRRSAGVSIY